MSQDINTNNDSTTMEVNDYVSVAELLHLLRSPWYVRSQIAANPATPLPLLYVLAHSDAYEIASDVAKNPNTPPDLLQHLLTKLPTPHVIAFHPNATPDMLRELAQNGEETQIAVALNPNTPSDVLAALAHHDNPCIRCAVLLNPNTSDSIVLDLYEDENSAVSTLARLRRYFGAYATVRSPSPPKPRCGRAFDTAKIP